MPYTNLSGIFTDEQDGNLRIIEVSDDPIVLVLGTAVRGDSETLYQVQKVSDAALAYGTTGTLVRGLYETTIAGAKNIRLWRFGATPASLIDIGSSPGVEIETVRKDDSAGGDYTMFWDASAERLYVWRASDGTLVYDNNPSYPLGAVNTGEVVVSGSATGSPSTDIGTLSNPVTLAAAAGEGDGPAVFTAGTDGLQLSRMETYQGLYDAYELLADQQFDVVVPMNVYLDDLNVMDLTAAQISTRSLTSLSDYPTAANTDDVLGKVFVQEYQGKNYYWWWFPTDPTSPSFSAANIYPSAGSASATTDAFGTTLTADNFHEVNFAYQLANFCYTHSRDVDQATGVIGVLPPASFSIKDVATWVGTLPTTETDGSGNTVIASGGNGTGLLGNKFMSGRISGGGLTGFTVNGVEGLYNGGFIATDTGFLDGTQQTDNNDHLVDIGKYISVVAAYPLLSNQSSASAYASSGAATYGGFYETLSPRSAPTNKKLRSVRLQYRIGPTKLDLLAGQRYVNFQQKSRGIVVADAPTAARPDSDYQRLSTMRQVKACIDSIRQVGEPYLGEGMDGATLAALETAIDGRLKALVKARLIKNYDFSLTSTRQQMILGQATVDLKVTPAFELRQITVVVSLAAV